MNMADTLEGEPVDDNLLHQLKGLLDEKAIVATLYRYGDALDHGNRDQFINCFTSDAEYVVKARLDAGAGFTFVGHEQLRGYFDSHTHAPDAFHKHVTVNPLVEIDNGKAQVQSYFLRVDSLEKGAAVVLAAGKYLDRFERGDDGGWRIRTRVCEVENL
jgi:3-phenylpropionate/cinnamic acid dioxygenase small subunit